MKQVRLLDDVCWGKVARVQWSKVSGNLYSIGGDPDQSLKVWHKSQIVDKKGDLTPRASQPTTKEPVILYRNFLFFLFAFFFFEKTFSKVNIAKSI